MSSLGRFSRRTGHSKNVPKKSGFYINTKLKLNSEKSGFQVPVLFQMSLNPLVLDITGGFLGELVDPSRRRLGVSWAPPAPFWALFRGAFSLGRVGGDAFGQRTRGL